MLSRFVVCSNARRSLLKAGVQKSCVRSISGPTETFQNAATWLFDSQIIYFFQENVWLALESSTSLPWWAIICSVAAGTKLMTLPFYVKNQRTIAKSVHLTVAYRQAVVKQMDETPASRNWSKSTRDEYMATTMKYGLKDMLRDAGASKSGVVTLGFVQTLPFFFASVGLRHLVMSTPAMINAPSRFPEEMSSEGILWFTNLLVADPVGFLGLPAVLGVLVLSNMRLSFMALLKSDLPMRELTVQQMYMNWQPLARIMLWSMVGIVFVPYSAVLPSCIGLYLSTYLFMSVVQSILFLHPKVKQMFGVLPLPYDTYTPIRKMLSIQSTQHNTSEFKKEE